MRKILIIFLIIILLALFGVLVISGVSIAGFEIPSVQGIISRNNELDQKIADVDNIMKTDYSLTMSGLDASYAKLQDSKKRYQDIINYSTEDEIRTANQTEKYDLSFLWTKIGIYATKNKVTMKADVSEASIEGLYDISFKVYGQYLSISNFIYAIENDSQLGFKIEDFTIVPYSEEELQATFAIRNIAIDEKSLGEIAKYPEGGQE